MKRTTIAVATALGLALGVSACGQGVVQGANASGDVYNWDFTITTGNTSTWHEGAELFAETLREQSGGRMNVNIFTNEQLSGGDPAAGVEQLMSGGKAFSYNSTIIYAGLDPKFGAINAPFLYTDITQAEQAIDASALAAYEKLSESKGVKLLGFGESGFRQVTNNVRPIDEPADIGGIKMRIPGIGLFTDAYQLLGANPTTMNFAEVFTSLQQGTIEGQENPIDIIHSSGLQEVQKYLTVWNYVYDPLILGMNKEMFDGLTPEDQQIVLDAAAKANQLQIQNNREKEAGQLDELRTVMEVTELTPEQTEAFQEAMAPLYEQYRDIWGAELADAVQAPKD
jgi:tripartite ATP-independent transporter DctP family solute receptor